MGVAVGRGVRVGRLVGEGTAVAAVPVSVDAVGVASRVASSVASGVAVSGTAVAVPPSKSVSKPRKPSRKASNVSAAAATVVSRSSSAFVTACNSVTLALVCKGQNMK